MKALERAIDYLVEHRWARIAWYFAISAIAVLFVLVSDAKAAEPDVLEIHFAENNQLYTQKMSHDECEANLMRFQASSERNHPLFFNDNQERKTFTIQDMHCVDPQGNIRPEMTVAPSDGGPPPPGAYDPVPEQH